MTSIVKRWNRLYEMDRWPPGMSEDPRRSTSYKDWLMTPLIMHSVSEGFLEGRANRRHPTWTFDVPEEFVRWRDSVNLAIDAYLVCNGYELGDIITLERGVRKKIAGSYVIGDKSHIDNIMSILLNRYANTHHEIMEYIVHSHTPNDGLHVVHVSVTEDPSQGTPSSVIKQILDGNGRAHSQMHELHSVNEVVKSFLQHTFKEDKIYYCSECKERWFLEEDVINETCKHCDSDNRKFKRYRMNFENDMDPLGHGDPEAISEYQHLMLMCPLSNIEECMVALHEATQDNPTLARV